MRGWAEKGAERTLSARFIPEWLGDMIQLAEIRDDEEIWYVRVKEWMVN